MADARCDRPLARVSILPKIEIFQKPAQGVAVTWAGDAEPTFVVPFPRQTLLGAFATDAESLLFIGSRLDMAGGSVGATLFARFKRHRGCVVLRGEIENVRAESASVSRDGRSAFTWGLGGIVIVHAASLTLTRRIELYRFTAEAGWVTSWNELDGQGPQTYDQDDGGRRERAGSAGWRSFMIQFSFQVSETADGALMHVDRWTEPVVRGKDEKQQCLRLVDWRQGKATRRIFRSQIAPTPLDRRDPGADLFYVTRHQIALFRSAPPASVEQAGLHACEDAAEHAVVLHLLDLASAEAAPITISVRTAGAAAWAMALTRNFRWGIPPEVERDAARDVLDLPSPRAEVEAPRFWGEMATAFLPVVYQDPRDGLVWLSFADDHIRSIDGMGHLGPLVALGGTPNVPDDDPYRRHPCPRLSFQGEDLIVVRVHGQRYGQKMARYVFRAADVVGRLGPVTLTPAKPGPLPGSHAKAFSTWLRQRRRDRFTLPDWSRDSVAAALDAQRAAVAAGLPDLVDPEEDRLTFSYKVAGKPVKEPAFFKRIVKEALPVVPELRALLSAYTDQLGKGGEGVQPWQDPDEGVGGLGPALRALALLDPDCLGVLRAYLETRDGEHEGYCLDVVVPAYLDRHGWRDATTVRFGIYSVLNRFWGGAHPYGLDGLRDAMADLSTPEAVATTVLREAEHFGRKPDWGHDAAAYRAAFRALLNPTLPFEAAVLDGLREVHPPVEVTPADDP